VKVSNESPRDILAHLNLLLNLCFNCQASAPAASAEKLFFFEEQIF
jgi:hypothetical protein